MSLFMFGYGSSDCPKQKQIILFQHLVILLTACNYAPIHFFSLPHWPILILYIYIPILKLFLFKYYNYYSRYYQTILNQISPIPSCNLIIQIIEISYSSDRMFKSKLYLIKATNSGWKVGQFKSFIFLLGNKKLIWSHPGLIITTLNTCEIT